MKTKYLNFRSKIMESREFKEASEAAQKDLFKDILDAVERGSAQFYGDFFINVRSKKERLLDGIPRFYVIPRQSAPYPVTNTTLYRYIDHKEELELWWSLPDKGTCVKSLVNSSNRYALDKATRKRYESCVLFMNGTLDEKVKKYNDSIKKIRTRSNFNPADFDKGRLIIAS